MKVNTEDLKKQYNHYLERYKKGCDYIYEHPEEAEKYEGAVIQFLDKLNAILKVVPATEDEIMEGFKIE